MREGERGQNKEVVGREGGKERERFGRESERGWGEGER